MKIKLPEDYFDFNDEDYRPPTKLEQEFVDSLFELLQGLVPQEASNEEFVSEGCAERHYRDHCLGSFEDRVSRRTNVYYDFTTLHDYKNYERTISQQVLNTDMVINSLYDIENVSRFFRKLFEGAKSIYFTASCGFHNSTGPTTLGINAFATDKTDNYKGGNTINIFTFTPIGKTISLYVVDAHYLEMKLNHIIQTYNNGQAEYNINNPNEKQ